jgi:hypothetical protein
MSDELQPVLRAVDLHKRFVEGRGPMRWTSPCCAV